MSTNFFIGLQLEEHGVTGFQILGGPGLLCHPRHHAVQQVIGGVLGFQQMGVQLCL